MPKRRKSDAVPFSGQVQNVRESLPAETGTVDPKEPRMPFESSYKLNYDQELKLTEYCCERVRQLSDQLGRVGDAGTAGGRTGHLRRFLIPNSESFIGKRSKYTLRYYSHVEDRKLPNTIYETSNLTDNASQRITQQMIAKAILFFLGQPDDIDYFTTMAVGAESQDLADKIKKHSRWKLDECGVKQNFIDAFEYCFIRGEAVVKPTHQQVSQIYKRTAVILCKDEEGEDPIYDAHGDYIVQGDAFVPAAAPAPPNIAAPITGPEPGATPESIQAAPPAPAPAPPAEPPQMVLKRDGVTPLPPDPNWVQREITRQLVTFEGPECPVVYYQDFLCPESATSIQKADLIAHLYDLSFMKVVQMFRGQYGEGDVAIAKMQAAIARLQAMSSASNLPKSAATQARVDFKESDTASAYDMPICHIAECYVTYDADGDGVQEELMVILDYYNRAPIYYEYLANVTVKGLRPFRVIRPMPVDQRWYGFGAMELFDADQESIDLQVNRYNFANSKSGRIDFWNPNATLEGRRDPNMLLNHGRTYTLVDGKKAEDAYEFVQIPFESKDFQWFIEHLLQMMQTKAGIVNSRDQAMSGLPTNRTATGVNEIRDSGEELFLRILSHLFKGFKESLQAVVEIIYANMNKPEIFTYFNGRAMEILSLSPEDVRDLPLSVTLELSRTSQRKAIETGEQVQGLISWFYSLPLTLQQRLAPWAQGQMKAFGTSNADEAIEPMDMGGGNQGDKQDKPSAKMNAIAAAAKAGMPVSVEDLNASLAELGYPAVGENSRPAAPPPAPAGNGSTAPAQSVV